MICRFVVIAGFLCVGIGQAQSTAEKKFEVDAHFSVLVVDDVRDASGLPGAPANIDKRTEPGVGVRFAYNLNRYFALEAEGNLFPRNYSTVRTDFTGGRIEQGLFGVKAGIRKERFGLFGKIRPGFVSSDGAVRARFPKGNGTNPNDPFGFETIRATQWVVDVGGVVEFYPSRRTIVRFDLGDTITRYPHPLLASDVYTHKLQFSVGYGFRF